MYLKIRINRAHTIKIIASDLVKSTSINSCYKSKQNIYNKTYQIYETQYIHLRSVFIIKVKTNTTDTPINLLLLCYLFLSFF